MAASQAALLDELMGRNRNAAPTDRVKEPHWSDPDICKPYLCAFCPNELFTNTKSDLGLCQSIHEEKMRDLYQKSSRRGKMGYEDDFAKLLQSFVDECDKRIQRGHQRLKGGTIQAPDYHAKVGPIDIIKQDKIDALTKRIEELLTQAETLGSEGNADQAQGVMKLCEQLKIEKSNLEGENRLMNNQGKELEVCEICAAFRIKDDAPQRVEEHLAGKMHIGYARIRDYLREYHERKAAERNSKRYSRDRSPEHELRRSRQSPNRRQESARHSKDRDRSYRRDREDDRKRDRDDDRRRDRDREDKYRQKDRDEDSSSNRSSKKSHRQLSPFSSKRRLPEGSDY